MSSNLLLALLALSAAIFVAAQNADPLCGTQGHFCPEVFEAQVPMQSAGSCKTYSDVFKEPNMTSNMQQNVPLANYTYTNNSEVVDNTTYLSEVLQSKAYELYADKELGFLDGSQGCKSGTVKTEFPSTRNNSGSCSIDVTDVLASVTPILQEKWMYIYYGKSASHPAKSCLDIFQHDPLTPSGMYWIKGFNGVPTQVYCEMEGSNNCDGAGGWMRVYKLDLESSNTDFHNCPSADFEKYDGLGSNKNLCRRVSTAAVCRSAYFSVNDVSYSKVCGKAKGYQKGTTDAFWRGGGAHSKNVDDNYVDGISITHGNPRTHIFTLACGCSESGYCWIYSRCPCQSGQNPPVPKFIGHDDFYCEAASYWHPSWGTWYTEPVWDAKNCDWKEAPCCSVTDNIPWFYKTLSNPTSDSIEVRVCTDETTDGEDVGVSQLELYVK